MTNRECFTLFSCYREPHGEHRAPSQPHGLMGEAQRGPLDWDPSVSSTVITPVLKLLPKRTAWLINSSFIVISQKRWFNLSGIRSQKWAVTAFVWNSATESAIPTGCNDIKEIHGQRYDLLGSPHRRKRVVFVLVERYECEKTIRQALTWHLGW